ncbi:hypothetical protein B9T33_14835 [Acinetobacter sp. ANC 5054]|uniref:hypothetical protein n=1 Tax=Acinetobacter sp. ANC 5054 TaxID=1977877 RepID=UPI000A3527ED|nr:hypothetical protein [Acinetobacter sp. ANC 5054]OTG77618.1 hypothetical protein B9T33_14835 [Acinetobacter sp. ANC 5054]
MTIDLEKIIQFKSKIQLEQLYNIFVSVMIAVILVLAVIALFRPISIQQYRNVAQLAMQQSYPETQEMAETLQQQKQIKVGSYLKLMHAYQMESVRAHQLPALPEEQPQ